MPTIHDTYFTETELAEFMGCCVRTVIRWRVAGTGPAYTRIQRRVLYRKSTVEKWLSQLERKTARAA